MKILSFVAFSIFIFVIESRPNENVKQTCGYDSCHPTKSDAINVHLVPHTHDDVGWLKTVDQYYYGSRNNINKAGVQYILDSVVDELIKDPVRRFVYVESAYFDKWWSDQNDQRRHHVKRLVAEGRLEFAGGAWSMNDEAAAHYHSVLDQLTWGLRFLNDTFGECGRPKAGWQIDPFGHSRELANMWSLSGFDGLLLGRVDYQDRRRRSNSKELEMLWRGSDDLGSDIMTGIMFNTYSPPPGFCFDILCTDEPIIDNPNSPDYNVDKMVENFLEYVNDAQSVYKTNNIIITMGGDFTYQNANLWYKNMDKLIKYVNEREPKVNLLYSTPACYIKSLYDSNAIWPVKQDDFFPYASDEHAYWTGYFTSRPTFKYYERRGNNFLQVCKQLYAMTNLNARDKVDLNMLRTAMGIMQHHDAITGTEKQNVAKDYERILENGIQDCLVVVQEAMTKLMSEKSELYETPSSSESNSKDYYLPMTLCQLNASECVISETNDNFVVTVYNPLGHTIDDYIRLPIAGNTYDVTSASGEKVETQIVAISENVLNQLKTRNSIATKELVFLVEKLPRLGYKSFYVQKTNSSEIQTKRPSTYNKLESRKKHASEGTKLNHESRNKIKNSHSNLSNEQSLTIGNEYIQVSMDPNTGYVGSISQIENNKTTTFPLVQEILFYEGMSGNNNVSENRASGAYIFRPKSAEPLLITDKPINKVVKGKLVEEIHQRFSDWASQIIRVYRDRGYVEFEWLIGPIPIEDKVGKEVISRFTTDFKSENTFYTDSNGRQLLKRILNKRPTWKLDVHEPVSGNYYPVTSMISIKDESSKKSLFVLTDRSQGGSSLKDGQIELMVHRRLLHDDAFGVEEALNETENGLGLVARGTHYLVIGKDDDNVPPLVFSKILALSKLLQPAVLFTSGDNLTMLEWKQNKNEFNGISSFLPPNVHLLTLEPWKGKSVLLRLEHFFQKKDSPDALSNPATVDLEQLFSKLKILSVRETNLAANLWKSDMNKMEWTTEEDMAEEFNDKYNPDYDSERLRIFDEPSVLMMNGFEKSPYTVGRRDKNYNFLKKKIKRDENKFVISLDPMEIKTFVVEVEFR
ncbi:lysosomal alpha-mannosidase-like isoform X2 [Arctopsyche grandis]|uniref:lysosomal alpha-mannosidase-like isoform X2 n=1 Tax=Arctopsyche grandis TaxID=121162 RepID=UPI00406DA0A3